MWSKEPRTEFRWEQIQSYHLHLRMSYWWLKACWFSYQSEFGEDWVLPQWVVNNILQHRISLPFAVALPNKGRLSHTWSTKRTEQQLPLPPIQEMSVTLQIITQRDHLIPVSTTASPMQKSILMSVAIMFQALGFVKWNSFSLIPWISLRQSFLYSAACVCFAQPVRGRLNLLIFQVHCKSGEDFVG